MIERGWGGGGACILRKRQDTENTEEFCVLLIEGWSLFFSLFLACTFAQRYTVVCQRHRKATMDRIAIWIGQNYCMDEICLVKVHVHTASLKWILYIM